MNVVKESAYAKINLFLDVFERREDGFHNIRTVMQTVSLCDEVTVTLGSSMGGVIRIFVDGNKRLPTDSKNIAYTAARLFLDTIGAKNDVTIRLSKKIPVCAGLAGGSADAAAVLRALNKLFKRPMTDKLLMRLAERLGSDVPFCLVGGTAICEGRGEKITRISNSPPMFAVIAVSDEWVSTPMAYAELDKMYKGFAGTHATGGDAYFEQLISSLNSSQIPDRLFNVFEGAVLPDCKAASHIKDRLTKLGARSALMSGSGPAVFGVFDTKNEAEYAVQLLSDEGFKAYFAQSVK